MEIIEKTEIRIVPETMPTDAEFVINILQNENAISNIEVSSELNLSGLSSGTYEFSNCDFNVFKIKSSYSERDRINLIFRNCFVRKGIFMGVSVDSKIVSQHDIESANNFRKIYKTFGEITINNCQFTTSNEYNDYGYASIKKLQVRNSRINLHLLSAEYISIKDSLISRFSLIKTNKLSIRGANEHESPFHKVTIKQEFTANCSFVNLTAFEACNFSKATIDFESTSFGHVSSIFSTWPTRLRKYSPIGLSTLDTLQNIRQLKKIAIEGNDFILEKYMNSLELHAALVSRLDKKNAFTLIYTVLYNFNLVFSYITNNFGRNWLLPAIWILVVGGLFYISINGMIQGDKLLGNYWEFLLPTHKTSIFGDNVKNSVVTLDVFSRIIIGSLVFQLIRAFRFFSYK